MNQQERLIESDKLLRTAATTLRSLGLTEQPELIEALADGSLSEYIDKICECTIAAEQEKLERQYAVKLALERFRMKLEYEVAVALKGSGVGGWNSQGIWTVW